MLQFFHIRHIEYLYESPKLFSIHQGQQPHAIMLSQIKKLGTGVSDLSARPIPLKAWVIRAQPLIIEFRKTKLKTNYTHAFE